MQGKGLNIPDSIFYFISSPYVYYYVLLILIPAEHSKTEHGFQPNYRMQSTIPSSVNEHQVVEWEPKEHTHKGATMESSNSSKVKGKTDPGKRAPLVVSVLPRELYEMAKPVS